METFFKECQNNVISKNYKVRGYIDAQLEKNKKDAELAANYLFSLLISDKIFKHKLKKASISGKKRIIIYKFSIIERIFIPLLNRSYNIDFLLTGKKGPDIGTLARFGIEPVYQRFEKYIIPFKTKLIKDQNIKYIEISW